MPHFIVEYSRSLEKEAAPTAMLDAANTVANASGQFGPNDVKVRLLPVDHGLVGGKVSASLHITVYLLSGRDKATKKALTQALVDSFAGLLPSAVSVSANAIDMDRETYSKIAR